jgi:hypothetical protein
MIFTNRSAAIDCSLVYYLVYDTEENIANVFYGMKYDHNADYH